MIDNKFILNLISQGNSKVTPKPIKKRKNKVITVKDGIIRIEIPNILMFVDEFEDNFGYRVTGAVFFDVKPHRALVHEWFAIELYYLCKELLDVGDLISTASLIIRELERSTYIRNVVNKPKRNHLDVRKIRRDMKWAPHAHQTEYLEWYNDITRRYGLKGSLMGFTMGGGKALSVDSKILKKTGWGKIGDIKVGDEIIGSEGKLTKVLEVHPQPEPQRLFNFIFNDGTEVKCNEDHMWTVLIEGEIKNITVPKLLVALSRNKDVVLPVMPEHKEDTICPLPIPPNILVTMLMDTREVVGDALLTILEAMGMKDFDLNSRFIPSSYIYHSQIVRQLIFYTVTAQASLGEYNQPLDVTFDGEMMAKSFVELCRMMGHIVSYAPCEPGVKMGEEHEYTVNSEEQERFLIIFHETKELEKITRDTHKTDSICIKVEASDSLFLTDGFTLTHNTYMGLAVAAAVDTDRIIIVSPLPAITDPWETAIRTFYNEEPKWWSVNSKRAPENDDFVLICNFNHVDKLLVHLEKLKVKDTLIILDESHMLNTIKAGITESFLRLSSQPYIKDTLFLTGTPIKARKDEVVTLLRTIDPLFTRPVEKLFLKINRLKNHVAFDLLRRRLGMTMFIVERSTLNLVSTTTNELSYKVKNGKRYEMDHIQEKMIEYSKKRIKVLVKRRPKATKRYFELVRSVIKQRTPEHNEYLRQVKLIMKSDNYHMLKGEMGAVNKYEKDVLLPILLRKGLHHEFRAVRSIAKYPKLKVLGETLGRVLGKYRQEAAAALVRAADIPGLTESSIKKTLFFTNSTSVVDELVRKAKPFKAVPVYGKHTANLKEVVKRINKDKTANPVCATFQSLSTAVPLPIISHVVIVDAPFRSYILGQALARAHRLGQDTPVTFTYLHLETEKPNILERSMDLAKWSAERSSLILGIANPIEFPESVSDEVRDTSILSQEVYAQFYDKPQGGVY